MGTLILQTATDTSVTVVAGMLTLFTLFLSLTAYIAARNVFGDVELKRVFAISPVLTAIAVVLTPFGWNSSVVLTLTLGLDFGFVKYLYGWSARLSAYVIVTHFVVSVFLGLVLFNLSAILLTAPSWGPCRTSLSEAAEPPSVPPCRLLWNDAECRPCAPSRLLLMPVTFVAVSLVVGFSPSTAPDGLAGPSRFASLVVSPVSVGVNSLAAFVVARYVDRRTVADLGLRFNREWMVDLGSGPALGMGLMTAVFVAGVAAGWIIVSPAPLGVDRLLDVGLPLTFFVVAGIAEELLFRGIVLTGVAEDLRWRFGPDTAVAGDLAVSSTVFSVAHYANPNAGLASTADITLTGVMLGLGYALTDDPAIPTGIRILWNFVQGGVFGFAISDLDFGTSLAETTEHDPDVITGGAFGPEAGLFSVGTIVPGTVCIAAYIRVRRGDLGFEPSVTVPSLCWKEWRIRRARRLLD